MKVCILLSRVLSITNPFLSPQSLDGMGYEWGNHEIYICIFVSMVMVVVVAVIIAIIIIFIFLFL